MGYFSTVVQPDISLILGLFLLCLSLLSFLSALAGGRKPVVGIILATLAIIFVSYAWHEKPGGYTPRSVAMIVYEIIADILN